MNSPAFDSALFPPAPAHRFQSAPVFIEPMLGSGERLCVLCAVQGDTGWDAAPLLAPEMAECLYGAQAPGLLGYIEILRVDLARHLAAAHPLDEWRPTLQGAFLGDCAASDADSPADAVGQVAALHASFCSLSALGHAESAEPEARDDGALKAWVRQAQTLAAEHDPSVAAFFDARIPLAGGDSVTVHYARGGYALNLGLLVPTRLGPRSNDAKIKMWNLEHLPGDFRLRSIVLGIPRDDAPDMAESRVRIRVHERVSALNQQAQASLLTFSTVYTAAEAAVHIVQAEAA